MALIWSAYFYVPKSGLTSNAHPSVGCASSMYKRRKSTSCWKTRQILLNFCRSAINSGQVQEPKLTTKGLPTFWKSSNILFLPSRPTKGTLMASPPGRTLFVIFLHSTYLRAFSISELNMVGQKSSRCTRHFDHFRNTFCSNFVQSGMTFRALPKTKASRRRLAKK